MKRIAIFLATLAVLCPVPTWAQNTAADAFAQRDFVTAQQVWQQEAAAGSAEAMLGLGLLADRGFGGERDLGAAFGWYAKAAELGLAEAQFNIAIMFDAGLGRSRDADQALLWYTRAALRDHARAQYNLGLLLESGDGVTANAGLAAYWFEKAALSVLAAAQKETVVTAGTDALVAPALAFARSSAQGKELVWQAQGATSATYLVEMFDAPAIGQDYAAPILSHITTASGLLEQTAMQADRALWRVSAISPDGVDYAPSDWMGADEIKRPKGRITFVVDPSVPAMVQAAGIFADDLRAAGYWVRTDTGRSADFGGTFVSVGFASDQVLADVVSSYLPRPKGALPAKDLRDGPRPGEIIVNFAAVVQGG